MRYNDDGDAERLASLFHVDGTFQTSAQSYTGRDVIGALFRKAMPQSPVAWTQDGHVFDEPRSLHIGANPIVDVDGDRATAETDFQVVTRNSEGRAVVTLVGRFRDRFRRDDGGPWLIECRTVVSLAKSAVSAH